MSDHGIGVVLEQKDDQGKWHLCAFFRRKLQGNVKYDPDGNVLGYMGQRAWSVREKETYALVSCLLKFKSWISGRQVTFFTDHKSLESWYKQELGTMAGPLGRRGRWHEFLSRYNIVVVYKPGVQFGYWAAGRESPKGLVLNILVQLFTLNSSKSKLSTTIFWMP